MTKDRENPLEPGYRYIQLVNGDHPDFEEILAKSPGIHPFDVEDFIDHASAETLEKCKRFGFFQSVEQRIHSEDQILRVEEINPGMILFLRQNDEVTGEITVNGEPYIGKSGRKVVGCEGIMEGRELSSISLGDMGVIPYPNGLWNAWNWLQKPDRLTAIFRNKARESLAMLQGLFEEYFEVGNGRSLSSENQLFVAAEARSLAFIWTRLQLVQQGIIDRNHMSSDRGVCKDLEQELGVAPYHQILSLLDGLTLTGYEKAGLRRRAWILANKALEKAEVA